jgi:hypothetical protein
MIKWIDITEDLPTHATASDGRELGVSEPMLLITTKWGKDKNSVVTGFYNFNNGTWLNDEHHELSDITHWSPISLLNFPKKKN